MAASSSQNRIWVFPNRRTPGLAAVVLGMWYAGASQGNSAAYLLCFLLVGLTMVSAVHAWANLRGVRMRTDNIPPVFAGEEMAVSVVIESERRKPHFALRLRPLLGKADATVATLDSTAPQRIECLLPALRRGVYRELSWQLSSSFPLGFLTARQRQRISQTFHVYPAQRGALQLPRTLEATRHPTVGPWVAGDDYSGVRAWQAGESQRHIDWKAAARGQPLLTKQWTGEADEILCFDWSSLVAIDDESRLCQLARWIVLGERGSALYELRLPGKIFRAARGETHYHACLRALAEFPVRAVERPA